VLDLFQREMGLRPACVVADIGSGTGIFSEMLLKNGNTVFCVEPNADMRAAAERMLSRHSGFRSVEGTGENTGLPDASVDLVTCAQAFHWFDKPRAAAEFKRICKPGGAVAILWNDRRTTASPFLMEYDGLLMRYGTDYAKVAHEKSPMAAAEISVVFCVPFTHASFPNQQHFDREGLHGRVASASYTPQAGEAGYAELFAELDALFDRHARDGRVTFEYATEVYYARIA
jgi:ubiquinone/menaquinone biosynthesis C-methylase UbiE